MDEGAGRGGLGGGAGPQPARRGSLDPLGWFPFPPRGGRRISQICIVGHYAYGYNRGMGYQFIHVDGYARHGSKQDSRQGGAKQKRVRKLSAQQVADEAERAPGACPHVPHPQAPNLLYGCTPSQAVELASQWADGQSDSLGRSFRKDGLCLLAGVATLPNEMADRWPEFREATVEWLKTKYGERLRSVVEHRDESHPHLHFYATPLPGERFEVLHEGRKAAREAAQQGEKKGKQNAAYRTAMEAFQDDFGVSVASQFGLTRIGPSRRRLTRSQWKAEQQQARALAAPVQSIQITPDDVKKQAVRSGWLGSDYESSEALADRLTKLAQEQAKPLAFRAKLAEQRGESEARTEAAEATARAAEQRAEKARLEAEKAQQEVAGYLSHSNKQIEAKQGELARLDRDIDQLRRVRDLESGIGPK